MLRVRKGQMTVKGPPIGQLITVVWQQSKSYDIALHCVRSIEIFKMRQEKPMSGTPVCFGFSDGIFDLYPTPDHGGALRVVCFPPPVEL